MPWQSWSNGSPRVCHVLGTLVYEETFMASRYFAAVLRSMPVASATSSRSSLLDAHIIP
jgi:hypothetical protein